MNRIFQHCRVISGEIFANIDKKLKMDSLIVLRTMEIIFSILYSQIQYGGSD